MQMSAIQRHNIVNANSYCQYYAPSTHPLVANFPVTQQGQGHSKAILFSRPYLRTDSRYSVESVYLSVTCDICIVAKRCILEQSYY